MPRRLAGSPGVALPLIHVGFLVRKTYNDVMNLAASSNPRSITESPWYWAYLFCTGGLIALVVVGPRYAQRQTQIEQNGQKRQWAAQLVAGQSPSVSQSESDKLSIPLRPLFLVLGSLLAIAWIKLIGDHFKRRLPIDLADRVAVPGVSAEKAHP